VDKQKNQKIVICPLYYSSSFGDGYSKGKAEGIVEQYGGQKRVATLVG